MPDAAEFHELPAGSRLTLLLGRILSMWFVCLGLLAALAVVIAWRVGPNLAVAVTVLVSLLLPKWYALDVGGVPLDLRVASGIAALSVYCLHRQSIFRTRLVGLDYLMIALLLVHMASDTFHDGFHVGILLRIYGEWMVPYLAGRVSTLNWRHVRSLTPVIVFVTGLLVLFAACESFWNWNIFEYLFGAVETDGLPRNVTRWGMTRAFGPTKNPIYFGTLLLLLAPWSVYAAALAYRNEGSKLWLGMPLITFTGILCSGSRAPLLAIIPFAYMMTLVKFTRVRRAIILLGVLSTLIALSNATYLVQLLNRWTENTSRPMPTITVSGDRVEYTGTLHRLYLWDVYATAMRRAGWLGFGTERTTGFPPRVPVGSEQAATLKRLWCVDNAYILMTLRFGYLGVACFVLCGFQATRTYWILAQQQSSQPQTYCGAMCGAVFATLCVLLTVWMPHDFGFWFLWTFGAGAAMLSHTTEP